MISESYQTEQEKFWSNEFGNDYVERNKGDKLVAGNTALFSKIFSRAKKINSVLELGSNIGLNLVAIKRLLPECELSAVEINKKAVNSLKKLDYVQKVYHQSILEYKPDYKRDLVLCKGILQHINPDYLSEVYQLMHNSSKKYICIAEFYNPTPAEIGYRGHKQKLFKRDFAGEMLDKYKDLFLLDYGFFYRRDNNFFFTDITWFLLEKNGA